MVLLTLLIVCQLVVFLGISYLIYDLLLGFKPPTLEIRILLGMGFLAMLSQMICFYIPISTSIQLLVASSGLIPWLKKSFRESISQQATRIYSQPPLILLASITLTILIIILSSGPIIRDDTESYHLQSIKWIQEYGTVPGLANLHARYGFNSSWLSLISLVTPSVDANYYTCCNAILSLLVCTTLLQKSQKKDEYFHDNISYQGNLMSMIIFLSIWYYWRGNAQSANYDYYFLACCVIVSIQNNENLIQPKQLQELFLITPLLLFCIRPIYAPILLLSINSAYNLYILKRRPLLIKTMLTHGILLIFFLWRNLYLSGYILFPSTWIDIADVQWKMPREYARIQFEYINNFIFDRNLTFTEAAVKWINELFFYDRMITIFGIASGIFLIITRTKRNYWLIIAIALTLTVWVYISPEPRFIAGIFLSCIVLALNSLISLLHTRGIPIPHVNRFLLLTLIAIPTVLIAQKLSTEKQLYANYLEPARITSPPYQVIIKDNFVVNLPQKIEKNWNNRCYLTPLPCVYDSVPGVQLIGNSIKQGFYVEHVASRKISEN